MAEARPHFQQLQLVFAAHIRNPAAAPGPAGVPERRLAAYRELFFNNIESFLSAGFPVLRSLLAEDGWRALVRDFYARHRCETPLFSEIAREFLCYLETERTPGPGAPPFWAELAHSELVELALAVPEDEPPELRADFAASLPDIGVLRSPVAWSLVYRYPVHRIGPQHRPSVMPETPTCLVAYRGRDDVVHFMEANAVSHRLLELLSDDPGLPVRVHLRQIARELQAPEPDPVLAFGQALLVSLHQRGVVGPSA